MTASIVPMSVAAAIAVAIAVAVASVLAVGPLRRRAFALAWAALKASATTPGRALAGFSEKVRLRLAATLLDLGNHLMLPADERKAFRLRRRLSSQRARRLGIEAAATRAGAKRLDDVALEIPIGERTQEGNPGRTLVLSCVVYGPPGPDTSDAPEQYAPEQYASQYGPSLFWRVVNRASPGHRGSSITVEIPDLERALLSYHARPVRHAGEPSGARFFDEDVHDEAVA